MAYVFKEEARHGDNLALREYAQTRLPTIQGELIAVQRDERRTAGIVPAKNPTEYTLPKPWPSITPMGIPPSTTPPEPEG